MNNTYEVFIPFDFKNDNLEELKECLKDLSNNEIDFYAQTWVCDKLAKNVVVDSVKKYTIYFSGIPGQYRDWARYFALAMYCYNSSVKTIKLNIDDMKTFFLFLEEYCNSVPLEYVNITHLNKYKEYLRKSSRFSDDTKHSKWSAVSNFYIKMKGANGYFKTNIVDKNPFEKKRYDDAKYISDYVTNQLDELYKDESIPISMRAAYWILRFIPSRIEEIYKIPIDCVKAIKDGWTLTLHMYKQNGGYLEPELRVLRFKSKSVECNFFRNILEQQKEVAESLQDDLPEELKGYFFTYHKFQVKRYTGGEIKYFEKKEIMVACEYSIKHFIKNVCKRYNIRDEQGNLAHFSSHNLRHNGITDRLSPDGGFETGDVAAITHHKNDSMILKNYNHPTREQILQSQENVFKVTREEEMDKPVYFQGKIMNMTPMLEKRLLRDLRKHKMKLGICSDNEECKHQYRCLEDCEFYIPDCDDLPYFEKEVDEWSKKVEYYKTQNQPTSLENAEYNLKIHTKIRDRILKTIKEEA
ncbi:MAG: hypothetical protein ACLRQZ_06525 [Clostridia bacterium]